MTIALTHSPSLIPSLLINIHNLIKLGIHINHLLVDTHGVCCFIDVHLAAQVSLVCFVVVVRVNLLEEGVSLYCVGVVELVVLWDGTLGFLLGTLLHDVDGLTSCGEVRISCWCSESVLESLCSLILC